MHVIWMVDDRSEQDTCICQKKGSVIRSLGEDARKTSDVGRSHGHARMVAHDIAEMPSFLAVMVRRLPFFWEDLLVMFLTLGLYVMPIDKVEVEPRFVVAALIGRAQAQDFMVNGKRHREAVLSNADKIQAAQGTHTRQTSCPESILVSTMVWGQEVLAKHSQ